MTLTCLPCRKKGFRTLDEMQYHAEEAHDWCGICKTVFPSPDEVQAHRAARPWSCVFCFRCFDSRVGLEDHRRTAGVHRAYAAAEGREETLGACGGPFFRCHLCSEQYQLLHQLQHHRRLVHHDRFGPASRDVDVSDGSVPPTLKPEGPSARPATDPGRVKDARAFVDRVKERLTARPGTYDRFLGIVVELQAEKKDHRNVYSQVSQLFEDAPDLLEEFAKLVPGVDAGSRQVGADAVAARRKAKRKRKSASAAGLDGDGKEDVTGEGQGVVREGKGKRRKAADDGGRERTTEQTTANSEPSPSAPDPFWCNVCNTTIQAFPELAHHLLTACTYGSDSQIAEAQGFACQTCDVRFALPRAFEAHLERKRRHMRARGRKEGRKRCGASVEGEVLETQQPSTPKRRPAPLPVTANRSLTPCPSTIPVPDSQPVSSTLTEMIGTEDCTMYCRQCQVDIPVVETLVDHFSDTGHYNDTVYCYTCDETFVKPHLLWPHLYTSPRHERAPPGSRFEFSSTDFRWEALLMGQRSSGEAPLDLGSPAQTIKQRIRRVKLR